VTVPGQVFAQATHFENYETCETEEGVFGLAFSMISSHNYPSVLSNLETTLLHPIFSLYLDATDDFPGDSPQSIKGQMDAKGNVEYGRDKPLGARSQIVFGGVDQTHYEGCLKWHDLGEVDFSDGGEDFVGYWDFQLDDVRMGGTSVATSKLALVDSGSSYIVGPLQDVAKIALMNQATCFLLDDPSNPKFVDCGLPSGFDAAVIDCDQPFYDIEFVADGVTYVLEKEDLIIEVVTPAMDACILRVIGSPDIPVSVRFEKSLGGGSSFTKSLLPKFEVSRLRF
jgi:hypothetical protein